MTTPITDKFSRPIHDLRVSVIDRCNFRCTYCMPEKETKEHNFLDKKEWMNFDEIVRLVKLFVALGVKKVRLTGGEPLLRPDLPELIRQLALIERIDDLALTTNGSLLAEHATTLKEAGLQRLTISLDTLDSRLFRAMSGNRGSLDNVLVGIRSAQEIGFKNIKINVVVQKGVNEQSVMPMVELFKGSGHVLRFIEYMDVGNCNHWESKYVVPSREIIKQINAKYPLEPADPNYFGEVAQRYRYKDGSGEIGFVSSVSQPFCRDCTRARLSADGKIITCLFASNGTDLLKPLRSGANDKELFSLIQNVWKQREDRYSELRTQLLASHNPTKKVEMFEIGG
ncbi:MAG TPA: GTP 3',8-cyclase MoaA [Candidatus Omnitrophota bacterium]|nr:GTP 3',8-cyclase MoaA [Candidatus Omnitrophota bacterium]